MSRECEGHPVRAKVEPWAGVRVQRMAYVGIPRQARQPHATPPNTAMAAPTTAMIKMVSSFPAVPADRVESADAPRAPCPPTVVPAAATVMADPAVDAAPNVELVTALGCALTGTMDAVLVRVTLVDAPAPS